MDNLQPRETTTSSDPSIVKKAAKGEKRTENDWIDMKGEILPSAKTTGAKAALLNALEEDPEAKIIIYTQFLPMVSVLAKMCQTEKLGFCKYTGE